MTSLKRTRLAHSVMLVVVLLCITGAAQAKTINVTPGHSIQAAINAAVKGDVVVVAKGTYKENLDFEGQAITVQSSNPTDKTVVAATIIDGQKKRSVVTFQAGEKGTSVLKGFTLTHGIGNVRYVFNRGGGVECYNSSPTLTYNTIRDNFADVGGGVCCTGGSPTVTYNTISGNTTSSGGGGGIRCDGSSPTIAYNTISGNSDEGVYCDSGSPMVANNTISNNGRGIGCDGASPTITANTISNNRRSGVYCEQNSSPTLTNNAIRANSAQDGGGVYCDNSSPTLTNNTISGNSASYDYGSHGGGVYCWGSSPTLTNNIISNNSADQGGGVYCFWGSKPTLTNNTISGNRATQKGGGVYCEYGSSAKIKNTIVAFSSAGGGLFVAVDPDNSSKPVISYCDFYSNTGGNYVNWPDQTGKNGNINKNPLFANAAKGIFYERSKGGRWNVGTKTWVKDTVQSLCIDAGDPKSAFAKEPTPNGGRINMGAYGNTAYASKSVSLSAPGGLVVSAASAPASGGGAQLSVNLSSAANVAVTITNIAGRPIATLPDTDLPEGMSTLLWSGKSTTGLHVPAGTYLARLTARSEGGGQSQTLATVTISR